MFLHVYSNEENASSSEPNCQITFLDVLSSPSFITSVPNILASWCGFSPVKIKQHSVRLGLNPSYFCLFELTKLP